MEERNGHPGRCNAGRDRCHVRARGPVNAGSGIPAYTTNMAPFNSFEKVWKKLMLKKVKYFQPQTAREVKHFRHVEKAYPK